MNTERDSAKYSTLIDVELKRCFERVTDTLKGSLIKVMCTVKDILAEAIQCEMEALRNEQLAELKRQAKVSKGNSKKQIKGLQKSASEASTKENTVLVDSIFMANSNEDSLETSGVQKTANFSTITMDLALPLEDIQHTVLNDFKITVEEYDIVTVIKGSDRKSESDLAEVTTKKATVEQKVDEKHWNE
ncbi:hypothetical protein ACOME3_001129 [Neoechinorhynchus agilis]